LAARLVQLVDAGGARLLAAATDGPFRRVRGFRTSYDLAMAAIEAGIGIEATIEATGLGDPVDVAAALAEKRVLAPLDHQDPAHFRMTGTGLTHLGSAEGRDRMHRTAQSDPDKLTDSMRMFLMGLKGGKPSDGAAGAQPEWFYKGDGSSVTAPEQPLRSPDFAMDAGEEPEIVGLYVIGPEGQPFRLGFALANEFSDHVTERTNYLYLAHSKLRPAAFGPELLTGELPAEVKGASRIRRGGEVIWEKPFLSGEAHMSHAIANLEHHHFKYEMFRRPGDAHAHFFGTATLSFSDGVRTQPGDLFEIEAEPFTLPLRNPLEAALSRPPRVAAL
jgi:hypothetical protein